MTTKRIHTSIKLSSPTPWIIVAAIALAVAALWAGLTARFVSRSATAPGTILSLDETTDDNKKTFYVPEFSYTVDGRVYNSISSSGSNPPAYTVGQAIQVRYERTKPTNVRIDSFSELWSTPLILALVGLGSFILSLFLKISAGRKTAAAQAATTAAHL